MGIAVAVGVARARLSAIPSTMSRRVVAETLDAFVDCLLRTAPMGVARGALLHDSYMRTIQKL
ncbi:hypothetical protein C1S80_12465 [Mycolicibacterium aubagnense]|nr:hypothetical protein C1S80_12465 [Mycolicibacterium aubagnense]